MTDKETAEWYKIPINEYMKIKDKDHMILINYAKKEGYISEKEHRRLKEYI